MFEPREIFLFIFKWNILHHFWVSQRAKQQGWKTTAHASGEAVVSHFDRLINETRPFPGNVCLQDGTERRNLWTFSVNGNSLTCWKDSRGMFVYLDSLKPADKFLKASLLCGNDGSSWWVGLIDFIHFKNIIELLSSELSMDVTW